MIKRLSDMVAQLGLYCKIQSAVAGLLSVHDTKLASLETEVSKQRQIIATLQSRLSALELAVGKR